jgi:hypothetical protein
LSLTRRALGSREQQHLLLLHPKGSAAERCMRSLLKLYELRDQYFAQNAAMSQRCVEKGQLQPDSRRSKLAKTGAQVLCTG